MTFLRRLLRRQDGITLIMAIGILGILTMTGTTLIYYANTNARSAAYSDQKSEAYDLAEAGINEMMAVLARPENNALHGNLLPQTTSTYPDGTVTWWGVLNDQTQTWALTSTGTIKNPTGSTASAAKRTLTASVPVTPTYTQPLNNPAWNYIFNKHTGSACDMTLANNVTGSSRLYVAGNLCLSNNVTISQTALVVRGNLDLSNNAAVGASTSMNTRVETYVGGQCRYGGGTWASPCSGNQDTRHIYSKMNSAELRRRRQQHRAGDRHAGCRVRDLVRELLAGAGPELHRTEWRGQRHHPDVRQRQRHEQQRRAPSRISLRGLPTPAASDRRTIRRENCPGTRRPRC